MILCTKCGTQNADGASFCSSCNGYLAWVGKRVVDEEPAATAPASPTTPAAPAEPEAPADPAERPRVRTVELGRSAPAVDPEPMAVTPAAPPTPAAPRPVEGFDAAPTRTPPARPPVGASPSTPASSRPAAPPAPPGPGEVACTSCGTANPADRRFCRRCGAPLRDLTPAAATLGPPPSTSQARPWWKASFRGGRAAYDTALDLRAKLFRGTMVLAALGVGVSMAPPWGGNVRGWAKDQVESLVRGGPTFGRVLPSGASTLSGTALEGFSPEFAVDGQVDRAWATTWNTQAPALPEDAACGSTATGAGDVLRVTFASPAQVDRVVVRAGLEDANPNAAQHRRPKVLDLVFSDGSCSRLSLDDTVEPQNEGLEAKSIEWVNVNLVDTYPSADGPGAVTSVTELTFEKEQ